MCIRDRYELWRLRLFSFGGYGLALVAFGAIECPPWQTSDAQEIRPDREFFWGKSIHYYRFVIEEEIIKLLKSIRGKSGLWRLLWFCLRILGVFKRYRVKLCGMLAKDSWKVLTIWKDPTSFSEDLDTLIISYFMDTCLESVFTSNEYSKPERKIITGVLASLDVRTNRFLAR